MSRNERISYERAVNDFLNSQRHLSNTEMRIWGMKFAQNYAIGYAEGIMKERVKNVRGMLDNGLGWDIIYNITGLTEADYARNAQGL